MPEAVTLAARLMIPAKSRIGGDVLGGVDLEQVPAIVVPVWSICEALGA